MTNPRTPAAEDAMDAAEARAAIEDDAEVTRRILSVAHHLVGPDPEGSARVRRWVDESGRPTGEGRELVKALGEQRSTRTAVRNL